MKNKQMTGNLLLLLTAMIWGMAFVGQRVGMDKIEPITFAAARMALSAIIVGALAIIIKYKRKGKDVGTAGAGVNRASIIGGVFCGVFLASASLLQQIGIVYTTAGKAGFITAMYMLFVPVVSFVFFRRKSTLRVWGAVLLGLVGMYLLCITDGFSLSKGDFLMLLCAITFSGHILCCDHFVSRGNPIDISAIQFVTTALICSVFAFIFESPSMEKIISAAVPILYCGILSGGVGYTLQIVAQKHTEPTTASLIMSLESVFAVISGALILKERMNLQEIFGCIIMFTAIILVQIPERNNDLLDKK